MKKSIIIFIVVIAVVGGGAFYGGIQYGKSQGGNGFANLSAEQRQARMQQMGANVGSFRNGNSRGGAGFVNGDIISKDNQSITIALRSLGQNSSENQNNQAGSKIVFFSTSTQVSKFSAGNLDDLVIGSSITVNGTNNQDGSITAQIIQIRP